MRISVLGLNHASAPFELLERLASTDESRAAALAELKAAYAEAVILDTCNRSEIYTLTPTPLRVPGSGTGDEGASELLAFLSRTHGVPVVVLRQHAYTHIDQTAVSHLFSVAGGIDSLVVGEAQILSQVRAAFEFADRHHACGPILSALFRRAVQAGKRARTETLIGQGSTSAASLAVDRARQLLGPLEGCAALLVGTGKVSTLAARSLREAGVERQLIANRTTAHAEELARQVGAAVVPFDRLADALKTCDLVFSSTSAPHFVLSYEMVAAAAAARNRPLCIVDLALPRDVDPRAADLPGVCLIDLADLQEIAEQNLAQRRAEISSVRQIVSEETEAFWQWLESLRAIPTIAALHERAEQIRQSELADHWERLKNLSPQEKRIIESMTAGMIGRLLHEPTLRLKERAALGDGLEYIAALRELFGLDEPHD